MFKTAIKEFLVFNEAEHKAISNCIIIPLILTLLTKNLLVGLCWVLLVTVIYKFIQKEKTENAAMFFNFLKVLSMILLFITLLSLTIIIA
ncbi:hypothetical protein N5U00_07965 [Aliarcobacter butzleri]|uniref:hypothetical protein n=1 Tax=Aliarcobacter butzleri TaxID=28197 RepID=UPI0006586D98|nr:hypothetical protein [Aliarcobacter butzleri]KLE04226.1 hypothetical protein AF78_09060 [Aliarcobacter butzleri L353]MCT7575262.1 hypothetical protein [Aliarcobacter butzleri]